jgi:voltage-gated potassium channel
MKPHPHPHIYRKLVLVIALLFATLLAGASGYVLIEKWDFLDAVYMTVITVASVGYGEIHPLSDEGRIFTMGLILAGSGIMIYAVSSFTAFIVEGELTDVLKRLKMEKRIKALKGHYIVCGDSTTGRYAIEELAKTGRAFVVVERDPAKLADLERRGMLFVEGDATSDAVLQEASIASAKGLIATLHSDADNLFLVFTARGLKSELRIVAKAVDEESREKIRKAGADAVVMPNAIGALRLVSELVRPTVVTFLDVMLRDNDHAIRVEELAVPENSPVAGQALADTGLLTETGASLVALVREAQPYLFNPPPATRLQRGDRLIMMGEMAVIQELGKRLVSWTKQ